ncbi:MAG: hypothetical protein Ct9H90mP24_5590 [Methanobacteriota archaeon]|nr:MAG: hypothetical protein Ct9H90mP24_5590 [Euryarchaeota archaeon]
MTGVFSREILITCLKIVSCCGRPVDSRSMESVILERDRRTSRGFLIKKQFLKSSIQEIQSHRECDDTYASGTKFLFIGNGPVSVVITFPKSVSFFSITSSAPGWGVLL